MPKRKRMSFTVKKKRLSSPPPTQNVTSSKPGAKRRGRPRKTQDRPRETEGDNESGSEAETAQVQDDSEDTGESDREMIHGRVNASRHQESDGEPSLDSEIIYLSKKMVQKKWSKLSDESQALASRVFADVAREVIAAELAGKVPGDSSSKAGSRSAEVQEAVTKVTQSLERALTKVPYPPRTRDEMFDYERLVREIGRWEIEGARDAQEIARLHESINEAQADSEKREAEVVEFEVLRGGAEDGHKTLLGGRFKDFLKLPEKEPEDSAAAIKLAPLQKGSQPSRAEADLADEAKKLLEQLRSYLGDNRNASSRVAGNAIAADHAPVVVQNLFHLQGRPQNESHAAAG